MLASAPRAARPWDGAGGGGAPSARRLGRCAAAPARPRRHSPRLLAARASSSSSADDDPRGASPPVPSAERGRRAALACGCAACAFALLGARPGRAADAASGAASPAGGSADYLSRPRGGAYDEYFAAAMGGMETYEREVAGLKRQLFRELVGGLFSSKSSSSARRGDGPASNPPPPTILELGIGRGPNFQFLAEAVREAGKEPDAVRVVGVDPNPAMLPYAREAAAAAGFGAGSVELRALYGEQLGAAFGAAAAAPFDAAVVTLVLCSVPDVARTLSELKGVVASGARGDGRDGGGGRLLIIEHVRDPNPRSLRRLGQTLLSPLQRALADGCNLDRDTEGELRRAGLLLPPGGGGGRLRRLEVEGLGLLAPHVAGVLEL